MTKTAKTSVAKTRMLKRVVQRMNGIMLTAQLMYNDSGITVCQLFTVALVEIVHGELRIMRDVDSPISWFRISIERIADIQEFKIKRYVIRMHNGMEAVLEEHF